MKKGPKFYGRRKVGSRGLRKQYMVGLPKHWVHQYSLEEDGYLDLYIEGDRIVLKAVRE